MQVFHYSCVPGINAHPLCVCTLYLFDCYNYTLTFAVPVCMFVTERTLVRPDKAATRVLFMHFWNVFWMYSEAIHYIHNNGSESLLHALSSFSARFSLAHAHTSNIFLFPSYPSCLHFLHHFVGFSISLPVYLLYVTGEMWQTLFCCTVRYIGLVISRTAIFYSNKDKVKTRKNSIWFVLLYRVLHNAKLFLHSCQTWSFVMTNFLFWFASNWLEKKTHTHSYIKKNTCT